MEICSGGKNNPHEEICHNERQCPLCAALEEIKSLNSKIERLNNQE